MTVISEQNSEWLLLVKKLPSLFFGLMLYALAVLIMRDAGLGMNPWGVFHMGVSNYTPLTLGQVTQLTGFVILALSFLLKMVPGIASICNMIFIGIFVDYIDSLGILTTPSSLIGKIIMLFIGIICTGWATYFYLRVRLGAGPRDGLMEGLVKKTKKPVWLIRGIIEVSVLIVGYLLSGPVGFGTLVTAITIGFSVQFAFKVGGYDASGGEHINCIELFQKLKGNNKPMEKYISK